MIAYLETSAAAKLLIEEAASGELSRYLDELTAQGERLVSSMLLETELRRLAVREDLPQAAVTDVLDRIDLYEPDRSLFKVAGMLAGRHLRSLDALHIAAALRLDADVMVSYDQRQVAAALDAGLRIHAPGE